MALRNNKTEFSFLDSKHSSVSSTVKSVGTMTVSETSLKNAKAFRSLASASSVVKTTKGGAASVSLRMQKPCKPVIKAK